MSQRTVKSYQVLIGLEIHVQLATATKMFTSVANGATNFGAEPNTLVDPVILGLPGVLPVMNKKAVEYSIKVGLALGCRINPHSKWDRKSYYYPDLPKNYQISQYDQPLCEAGTFSFTLADNAPKAIRIRRAHLEEDAGKLMHEAPGGYPIAHSIVDLNRAGTPLLEIVTEPDFSSGEEVAVFGQELQNLVQYLGVSEGQMQMGHMRFEPNINVHITDADGKVLKTAITEIKNLNSFEALRKASNYEIQRQLRQWEETGSLGKKSTYGWDSDREVTLHQRDKEEANDYRYFPDPDLVPVDVDEAWLSEIKASIGELPAARRSRYSKDLGLSPVDAAIIADDRPTAELYEAILAQGADPRRASNLLLSHGKRLANEHGLAIGKLSIKAQRFAEIAKMMDASKVAASAVGPIFDKLMQGDAPAEQIATELGLMQVSDTGAIDAAIDALLAQNPKPLQDYQAGKQAALGSLMGMIMKSAKGLNPKLVQERLKARISR